MNGGSNINGNRSTANPPTSTSRPTTNGHHTDPLRPPTSRARNRTDPTPPPTSRTTTTNNNHGDVSPPPSNRPDTNGHQRDHPPHRNSRPSINGDQPDFLPPPPSQYNYQSSSYYPTANTSSSSSASFRGCCCCLFLLFSFIALLILAIVLVIVLAVKPKKPQFSLQQVGVQYVGITTNPNSASVSLTIRMLFTAVNDNKVGIKYGESKFTVMYRGIPLGRGTVAGFFQPAHSVRKVETTVSVDRVNLMQADAADLIRDVSLNDRVDLRILGDVEASIRVLGLTSPGVQVSVDCAIVISPRKQSLTYKQCGFDGLSV